MQSDRAKFENFGFGIVIFIFDHVKSQMRVFIFNNPILSESISLKCLQIVFLEEYEQSDAGKNKNSNDRPVTYVQHARQGNFTEVTPA